MDHPAGEAAISSPGSLLTDQGVSRDSNCLGVGWLDGVRGHPRACQHHEAPPSRSAVGDLLGHVDWTRPEPVHTTLMGTVGDLSHPTFGSQVTRLPVLLRVANGPWTAREGLGDPERQEPRSAIMSLTWAFVVERVTGIEPALSAWEAAWSPLR